MTELQEKIKNYLKKKSDTCKEIKEITNELKEIQNHMFGNWDKRKKG